MPKSTRARYAGRVDVIEMFSPRQSGPWRLLRPLHSKWGLIVLAVFTLAGVVYFRARHDDVMAWTVVVLAGLVLVLSFKLLWELIGLVIRSRAELAVTAGVIGDAEWLRTWMSPAWADATPLLLLGVLLAVPVSRRFVVGRAFAVLDRHRLRLCLRQTKVRTMNMDGSLPLMLWARPTKIGERVWLWTRAGGAADDIDAALDYIASACFARSARLHRVRRLATLVAVDIVRRDPLARGDIRSALAHFAGLGGTPTVVDANAPIVAASVADITTVTVPAEPAGDKKPRKTEKPAPAAPAVTAGTGDLSDYIDA